MLCRSLFAFSSCIYDFGVGGGTVPPLCWETAWEAQFWVYMKLGGPQLFTSWEDDGMLSGRPKARAPWRWPRTAKVRAQSLRKSVAVLNSQTYPLVPTTMLGCRPLTLQREDLITGCPGCQCWRCAQHVFLCIPQLWDLGIHVACQLRGEKERAEALKGKEAKLHTFSGLSWTNATGGILQERVLHYLLSILHLQILSRERMSKVRVWHLDQLQ